MRTMYDSTTVADLPKGGDLYAGYIDGRYETVKALRKRFPRKVVTITVTGEHPADVCDTEPGNVGADGAARWAARQIKAGRPPTIYCMLSAWPAVKTAVAKHVPRGERRLVSYWIAHYDGKAKIPTGAVAVQYADPSITGGHYDVSAVADHWPGVDPPHRYARLSYARRRQARHLRSAIVALDETGRPVAHRDRTILRSLRRVINRALRRG